VNAKARNYTSNFCIFVVDLKKLNFMVRPIQQIRRDLVASEEKSKNLATEIHSLYVQYLKQLSEATSKHLILCCYQLCTQNYPEIFLNLSFNQRQKFLQELQKISKASKEDILSALKIENNPEKEQNQLPLDPNTTKPESESPPAESHEAHSMVLSEEQSLKLSNPNHLFEWQQLIDKQIIKTLQENSIKVNSYFQKLEIIPSKVPIKVLEMAITSQENNLNIGVSSPNILSITVEATNENKSESFNPINIVAVCLRRVDLEFAEPSLSIERNKINNVLTKVNQIQKQYNQYKRELAIAEAEAAWRASWFED